MRLDRKQLLLYAVTDRYWANDVSLCEQVKQAIKGGATFVQLREKQTDMNSLQEEASLIQEICRGSHVPFIINDDVEFAIKMNADGVHVGQSDMKAGDVRLKIGRDKILGVSAQTVEQALFAEAQGADYLGVGAMFRTNSKKDADDVSLDVLKEICSAVSIPVIAIGGINRKNIEKLSGSGICGVAVISAIFAEKDITAATKRLRAVTEELLYENKGEEI